MECSEQESLLSYLKRRADSAMERMKELEKTNPESESLDFFIDEYMKLREEIDYLESN